MKRILLAFLLLPLFTQAQITAKIARLQATNYNWYTAAANPLNPQLQLWQEQNIHDTLCQYLDSVASLVAGTGALQSVLNLGNSAFNGGGNIGTLILQDGTYTATIQPSTFSIASTTQQTWMQVNGLHFKVPGFPFSNNIGFVTPTANRNQYITDEGISTDVAGSSIMIHKTKFPSTVYNAGDTITNDGSQIYFHDNASNKLIIDKTQFTGIDGATGSTWGSLSTNGAYGLLQLYDIVNGFYGQIDQPTLTGNHRHKLQNSDGWIAHLDDTVGGSGLGRLATVGSGGASTGGPNTAIQFNRNGVLGGSPKLTFDTTSGGTFAASGKFIELGDVLGVLNSTTINVADAGNDVNIQTAGKTLADFSINGPSPLLYLGDVGGAVNGTLLTVNDFDSSTTIAAKTTTLANYTVSGHGNADVKLGDVAGSKNNTYLHVQDNIGTIALNAVSLQINGALGFGTVDNYFPVINAAGQWGMVLNYSDRKTASASAFLATYTVGGSSDESLEVSSNILITASSTFNFAVTCTYTDEGGTSRVQTMPFSTLSSGFVTALTNSGGAVPYNGVPLHIRAKAGTTVVIATSGTFTSVTYNFEGSIRHL